MSPTVADVMKMLPSLFVAERAHGMDAVVHFRFTGAEAGEWSAVIRDGQCQVAQGIPRSKPTISLVADSSDFVRVASGQLDAMKAFLDGTLKVSGDLLLAPKLLQLFKPS